MSNLFVTHDEYFICPMSGIGKPPEEWSYCAKECAWYNYDTGYCALLAIGYEL